MTPDFVSDYSGEGIIKTNSAVRNRPAGKIDFSDKVVGEKCSFTLFDGDGKSYKCIFKPKSKLDESGYWTYFCGKEIEILKLEKLGFLE